VGLPERVDDAGLLGGRHVHPAEDDVEVVAPDVAHAATGLDLTLDLLPGLRLEE
jgi:hypothetical protein